MKILFLDIDGVVLPGRAYMLPNQTKPIVKVFDPCAVAMLNQACKKQGRKIVVHSSWIRYWDDEELNVKDHIINQGIDPDHFHEDWSCDKNLHWRYDRVSEWLARHPEVDDYVIVDDEPENNGRGLEVKERYKDHLLLTDFDEGITMKQFRRLMDGVFPR